MIAMAPRFARLATAAVLQLGALVLAHQLVFLARYGSQYGEALVHSGHGDAWAVAALTSLLLVVGLAGIGLVRLHRLGVLVRHAASVGNRVPANLRAATFARAFLGLAPRVAVLQLVLLSAQENIERVWIGQAAPGPAVLFSPQYAGGAWIAIAVSLVVSLVAALFEWRRDALLARLRAARASLPWPSSAAPTRPGVIVRQPVDSLLGRRAAMRAPPAPLSAA